MASPECRAFATWNKLNRFRHGPGVAARLERERVAAMVHLRFTAQILHDQVAAERYFLFEHPIGASSWQEDCIRSVVDLPGFGRVTTHQCQFGQEITHGKHKGRPIQKPTGFLSNSPEMLKALDRRCEAVRGQCSRPEGGEHFHLSGDHARRAARYPRELCRPVLDLALIHILPLPPKT